MAGRLKADDAAEVGRLLLLTTADTEILAAARASERLPEDFLEVRCANPIALEDPATFFDRELDGARVVLVRLLGGRRAWPEGLEELNRRCARLGIPLLAFGGEAEPTRSLRRSPPCLRGPCSRLSSICATVVSATRRICSASSPTPF